MLQQFVFSFSYLERYKCSPNYLKKSLALFVLTPTSNEKAHCCCSTTRYFSKFFISLHSQYNDLLPSLIHKDAKMSPTFCDWLSDHALLLRTTQSPTWLAHSCPTHLTVACWVYTALQLSVFSGLILPSTALTQPGFSNRLSPFLLQSLSTAVPTPTLPLSSAWMPSLFLQASASKPSASRGLSCHSCVNISPPLCLFLSIRTLWPGWQRPSRCWALTDLSNALKAEPARNTEYYT